MTRSTLSHRPTGNFYSAGEFRALIAIVSVVLASAMSAASSPSMAQITQGSGSAQPDNRTSAMGSAPDPAASTVHESFKPQTKDGGSATTRGEARGEDHKAQGAGGFDNGLYGTGTGSNKK